MTGIFMVEFEEYFETSTTHVSIIGAFHTGTVLFCGKC